MATVTISDPNGFDVNSFWVADSTVSVNERLQGVVSSSGTSLPLPNTSQTTTFSELKFTANGLDYTYRGDWTLAVQRGLLTGTSNLAGQYNTVEVSRNGSVIATYSSDMMPVDFGTRANIPLVDLVVGTLETLVGGLVEQTSSSPATLYHNGATALHSIAFAGLDTQTGGAGADTLRAYADASVMSAGGSDDTVYGGSGHDSIDGGTGADTMMGYQGNDTYHVDHSGDVVVEAANEGTDNVWSDLDSYTLGANLENLFLMPGRSSGFGNGLNNALIGNASDNVLSAGDGNDELAGGAGNDTMYGGQGSDTYYVGEAFDTVIENASDAGIDRVFSIINSALADNVEHLFIQGSATAAIGNTGNNVIGGNALDNVISGGAGNDELVGYGGNDTFIFRAGFGHDVIDDFSAGPGMGDVLSIDSRLATSFAQIQLMSTQIGSNTLITFNESTSVILINVLPSGLNANDFQFV